MTDTVMALGLQDIQTLAREERNPNLPRIIQFPEGYRVLRLVQVLGDDILALISFVIFSILILSISITNLNIQTDRQWVSLIYSIGGDIGMHLLVTSITGLILSIRIKRGIRLDSLCDYLSILAGPKAQFSMLKWSRFLTILTLIMMNHLAEQAVNYGVPSQPSLNPGKFRKERIIMAPLGGGVVKSGDPTKEDGNPAFLYFATGLSILASPPDTDNTAFYVKNGNQLVMYHLPHEIFNNTRPNLVTQEFETLGYVGTMNRELPHELSRCAATTADILDPSCEGQIAGKGSRFTFEVKNVMPPGATDRTDIQYKVSFLNTDEGMFGRNWTFSATLTRSIVIAKCDKRNSTISCEAKETGRIVPGKDWINSTAHENDLHENMATCFVNLVTFNSRYRVVDVRKLATKIVAAMHVRSSTDTTTTGGLATLQVKEEMYFDLADAILTFSGPWWLRSLLSAICILAAFSLLGHLIVKPSVPSTLVSIIGCMGEVVTEHRATCVSERKRAFQGLFEDYDRGLKVIGGLAIGTDRSFESGDGIKLVFGAGPGAADVSSKLSPDLAHFLIHTKDRVVPFSRLSREDIESLVIGYGRYGDEAVRIMNRKTRIEASRVIGYRRCGEGLVSVHKKTD